MSLVNLSADPEQGFFVEAQRITALSYNRAEEIISIFNDEGLLAKVRQGGGFDIYTMVAHLSEQGKSLYPLTYEAGQEKFVDFLEPQAVTFAALSLPGTDNSYKARFALRGYGWHEGGSVDGVELQKFLEEASQSASLLHLGPEEASLRGFAAYGLFINPAAIYKLETDKSNRIEAHIACAGSLKLMVPDPDQKTLNSLAAQIYNEHGGSLPFSDAFGNAASRLKAEQQIYRDAVFEKIKAAAQHLISVTDRRDKICLAPELIGTIHFSNEGRPRMVIFPQDTKSFSAINLCYPDLASRRQAFDDIDSQLRVISQLKPLRMPQPEL